MGGPAVDLQSAGWDLQLLGSAAATADSLEHASISVAKVFCKSLLVPVWHFISQYKSAAWYYWVSRLQYHITVLGLC